MISHNEGYSKRKSGVSKRAVYIAQSISNAKGLKIAFGEVVDLRKSVSLTIT